MILVTATPLTQYSFWRKDECVVVCIKDTHVCVYVHVYGSTRENTVRTYRCSSTVRTCGRSTVRTYGRSTVRTYGRSTVRAYGRSTVRTYGRTNLQIRREKQHETSTTLKNSLPLTLQKAVELASEKGACILLTTLPIRAHEFSLHERAF